MCPFKQEVKQDKQTRNQDAHDVRYRSSVVPESHSTEPPQCRTSEVRKSRRLQVPQFVSPERTSS